MKILVAGSGKLANSLLCNLSVQSSEILKWVNYNQNLYEKAILIHAGSGRQMVECLEFCSITKSTFIELSTGLGTEKIEPDFPLIICPNTSILVLKALNMLKTSGRSFENYSISISESHQSTKKSEPATAYSFAGSLKFPTEKIISVRDPEVQQNKIGISKEYMDKHAWHKIVIQDGNDELTIETKVLGHDSYAKGVKAIIETALKHNLENKLYTASDIIDLEG